jgi:ATP-dependent DNA ligase
MGVTAFVRDRVALVVETEDPDHDRRPDGWVTGTLDRPDVLMLGRYASDTGRLRYVGRTTPISPAAAAAIAPLLTRASGTHPWPEQLTLNWRSHPTHYIRVEPSLVVEIDADVATDSGIRWRHAIRLRRVRDDLLPEQVPLDLDLE